MKINADSLKKGLTGLNRFLNPGYELTISATDIDETAFNRVKEIIKDNGFIFVSDSDNIHRGAIVSEYTRKRRYLISITLIHTKKEYPERRLNVNIIIANEYTGGKPVIKADIDALGESIHKELSQFASKNRLSMHANRVPIPMT